ncbi:hypothetical protein D9M69_732230 [compost metagenome]
MSRPEKSTMSLNRLRVSLLLSPNRLAFRKMFSAPVSSWWNPTPSSMSGAIRPRLSTRPEVGCRMPLTNCSKVLLPEPL